MLKPGTFLADRYEIMEKIGSGGMSDVYRATDHVLERNVAIKVLKTDFAEDKSFVQKFWSEAQSAAALEHPNIVNIYDVGNEDGLYYIVMEYVEGITLKTYIEKKGHLNDKEVLSIAIQVGRGIEAAHKKGIIHRDIKPQNIIISHEGKVKVTDFGIARAASSNTMNANAMGSVHYVSPEQARNGYVDARSDIYSLGIVMYEMSTGRVPFDGDTAVSVAIQHLQGEMIPPSQLVSSVPVAVEKIILKATQKSPDRRYQTMSEFLLDLKKALISPDEDFVTIPDPELSDRTKVITPKELGKIRSSTDEIPRAADLRDPDPDPDPDDDDNVNPKLEKAITIMGILAAAIIAVIVLYLIGSFFGWFHFGAGTGKAPAKEDEPAVEEEEGNIKVPDLSEMTEDEAKEALEKLKLGFKNMGTESSEDIKEGLITRQSPRTGKKVKENTTVKVWISSGAGQTAVPNVMGQTEKAAKKALEGEGFDVNVEYGYSDSVSQGQVISQSPEAGSKGQEGDPVTITVSQGQEMALVPDVVGKTKEDAEAAITAEGLTVSVTEQHSSTVEAGKVISQGTKGGTNVKPDSNVSIVVSLGPEKTTEPDPGKEEEPVDPDQAEDPGQGTKTEAGTGSGGTASKTE